MGKSRSSSRLPITVLTLCCHSSPCTLNLSQFRGLHCTLESQIKSNHGFENLSSKLFHKLTLLYTLPIRSVGEGSWKQEGNSLSEPAALSNSGCIQVKPSLVIKFCMRLILAVVVALEDSADKRRYFRPNGQVALSARSF